MTVQLQKATQYYHYRTVLAIFPLAPDQIIAQDSQVEFMGTYLYQISFYFRATDCFVTQ